MKVLFLFTYGTSIKNWADSGYLSRELNFFKSMNQKYDVDFIFLTYGDESDEQYVKELSFVSVVPVYKYLTTKRNKIHNAINLIINLRSLLKKLNIKYDLIKTNQLFGAWIAIVLKGFSKKPLIIRTGYDLFLFSLKDKKNFFKIFVYYLLTFLCLNISNLYTVTSQSDFSFIKKTYIFKKNKLKVRRNWVDGLKFKNIKQIEFLDKIKILSVGRLELQKDYKHLIDIFRNTNFEVDIVGTGSLEKELKKLSTNNISYLGNLDFDELSDLYNKYVFYVSSTSYEGNPKSILEAMSKGCIVIAPNLSNIREIITNNENGIIYDKSSDKITDIIQNLIKDLSKLNYISTNATEHVKLNNSLNLTIKNEYKDYQYVLSK